MRYFSSTIADKKLSDFQKYDATLTKYEDRLNLVKLLINDDNELLHTFFTKYFDEYYDASPNQNGFLAEEDAVCKTVEGLGTYLLNSKDIQSNRKVVYRFWKTEKEYKNYKDSENVNESTIVGDSDNTEVIDMFINKDGKNHLKSKTINITKSDISDIKEVRELQDLIDKSKNESFIKSIEKRIDEILPLVNNERDLSRLKHIRANVERFVRSWVSNARENQVLIKKAIKRPFDFNGGTRLETMNNKLDTVDFYDEVIIKKLLPMIGREEDLMSEIGIIIYDFNQLLDEVSFSPREMEVIGLFRGGYEQKELANLLGINKRTVSDTIGRIASKVAKYYVKKLYLITQEKA